MESEANPQDTPATRTFANLLTHPRRALTVGLATLTLAVVVVLSSTPPAVTRSDAPLPSSLPFAHTRSRSRFCQAGEVLPRDATAIRLWIEAVIGPRVEAQAISRGRVIARGTRAPGWTGGSVTVPTTPTPTRATPVTICANLAPARETIWLEGVRTSARVAMSGRQGPLPGRIVIEYLRTGHSSWWSQIRSVARHMGLGHAGSGPLIPLLAFALALAVGVLTSRLILREMA